MKTAVCFVEPVRNTDLRVVLANTTATVHDHFAICYKTQYGELRVVSWLTEAEANRRAGELRKRGYKVISGPMDV